jgi:flagellar biosynthetic protein FliR
MIIQVHKLLLILLRITAFIVICPGFSFRGLPNIFKVTLAIGITLMVYTVVPEMAMVGGMFELLMLAIKETVFGLAIGYVTNLVFSAIEIAGQLIDLQVGFSMGSVFDPNLDISASNYGRFYYWLSIMVFFLLDLHHVVINTLIKSFEYVPLNALNYNGASTEAVLRIFSRIFELGLNLAAPMIIVVLLADVILGVISRTVPQINVLMLGMPLKAMVSFFVAMISLSWLMNSLGDILYLIPGYLEGFLNLFR